MRKINVLVAGRSRIAVHAAADVLAANTLCRAEVQVFGNDHIDLLQCLSAQPDLLLFCDIRAEGELQTLANTAADNRPALVVFGPSDDTNAIRMAMRAGARDYLTLPLDKNEMNDLVEQVADELTQKGTGDTGSLHVFVNGKGGSGATFLATNVAHGLVSTDHKVTLVDLDLQIAGLCHYLDLTPARDLLEAVQAVGDMDEVSAEAFTTEHESGLRLLSCRADKLYPNNEISPERMVKLLQTYQSFNDFVIVDLPRHIDDLNAAVLENADHISVVTQQSFPHLHDTARLLQIMRNNLGIDNSQLTVVVNRYSRDSTILLKDIENALLVDDIVMIPNNYRVTTESVNRGIPLTEVIRKASVVTGLTDFCQRIAGPQNAASDSASGPLQSLFRR